MSTLLYSLGRWSYRHPWRVLVSWLLLLTLAGGAMALFAKGTDNSFAIPGTEAQEGLDQLARTFPQASGTSAQLIIVAPDGTAVDTGEYRDVIEDAVADFERVDDVSGVTDPFGETVDGLVSDDGRAAIVNVQIDGDVGEVTESLETDLRAVANDVRSALPADAEIALGGEIFSASIPGLTVTELIGVLIALFVLIVTFRSLAVAAFPLVSAIIGVGLAISLIFVATAFSTISSTTPMLAIMLGLAVGIDYALFIVARHQDQVRAGASPEESAARATGTAGSAVVFAGVTVLIALVGLSLAGVPFLTTMGIAAAAAVAIAVLVAVTLTPALLGFAKGRVVGWKRRPRKRPVKAGRRGFAERWITAVTRRPLVATIAVVVGLGILAIPAASLTLALPNAGVQPTSSEARQAYDLTAAHFGPGENGPLIMTGSIVTSDDPLGLMDDLRADIESIPGVKEVVLATPNETADTGFIQIIPETAPDDPATADLVRELRGQHDRFQEEYGVDLLVTGFTAAGIDISDRLGAALIPFGLFVVGLSILLLTIVFRSIWVPIKATLGFLLSVAAAFGVVAAVFEWGWFADALHVAKTGPVISFMPIILMGVLFGLAMDYEVFLVSRMREDYVHARRSRRGRADRATAIGAVRSGFMSSARVVTAAAVIMFAVFAAFVPEGDASIKPIALGLAVGIAVDAFLVRMTLVPALMALLGDRVWWMPRWLDRVLPHFDIEGEALEHDVSRRDWPEGDKTIPVAADDLAVVAEARANEADVVLFSGLDLRVGHGGTLVAASPERATRRAFALTIAGRLLPSEGELRILGRLIPGHAAVVRRHTGIALLGESDPLQQLRSAFRGSPDLVVIDGLSELSAAERDQAAAIIRDAHERSQRRRRETAAPLAIVATDAGSGRTATVLDEAGRTDIATVTLSRITSPTTLEVTHS